ncbi:hypothetical protein BTO06_12805 [Tenacibaculum sp. SZ-18]|uniref:M23 family metallopeptidase n=1 Tax=Tenacibaculum sp. SZ-18 TaxID=754423 RepID=UPI000C2D2446|nr:M23 family metallopeptidase [Tenacibaculum sp. SZ-18]AUC15979.1 hypothetical protein BTO06_12805 [Tenacibaculum sp. SZ-18]
MKKMIFHLLIVSSYNCYANDKLKLYTERINNGFNIYAYNYEFCSMSVFIEFDLLNMRNLNKENKVYVLEPSKKRQLLTTLKVKIHSKPYQFNFRYGTNYGNNNNKSYDFDYPYHLHFENGVSFKVSQGYNNKSTHYGINENSIDFSMPVGTKVTALSEGVVVKVIDYNTKNCNQKECLKYNNIVLVYHDDDTLAGYLHLKEIHLKEKGASVKVGDKVTKGQVIDLTVNTGWSSGPHLHVRLYKQFLG